jgi:hypothetical protein
MGDIPEELKNITVILIYKKGDKQKNGNYKEISLYNACYKLYIKFKIKIESRSRKVPFGMPEWIAERQILQRSIVQHEITYRKKEESLIWKPTEHFLIVWKAFTGLKETNCLKCYKKKCSQYY